MDRSVRSIRQPAAVQGLEEAIVESVSESGVLITSPNGIERASQAVSCLIKPCQGDTVLLLRVAPSRLYILAILERTAASGRDVALEFTGSVSISSAEEVTIASKHTKLAGQQLDLVGRDLSLTSNTLKSYSDTTVLSSKTMKIASQTLNVVGQHMSRHLKSFVSMVAGNEVRKAGNVTSQVSDFKLDQSRHSIIDVRKDLKIDAERIHMG
ncbi:MAG: DUF3540 domain-containing protein [Saccharospirillum sp.]|uniref:DUF3540 domain-containing protein n=1 Tax=Saccharospirillum sp. TaxID=2033801 RepID=UPI0032986ADF